MTIRSPQTLITEAGRLIEKRTGLAANSQFRGDLETILYNLSQGEVEAFVKQLENSPEHAHNWQILINALTIGETYFFRDPTHFRVLQTHILPALVLKRRQEGQQHLNIWSVGCATGEEPYSIAIALHEFLSDLPTWRIRLVGTDLNTHALDMARQGIYRKWAFRQPTITDAQFQQRYFNLTPDGPQIKKHISDMVTFRTGNVLSGPPLPQLDIIFCRNVLIYFKGLQVERVENIFYEALAPGGWLLLGQSEAIRFQRERWVTHLFPGSAIYQKPAKTMTLPSGQFAYKEHQRPTLEIAETQEIQVVRLPSYEDAVQAIQTDQLPMAERYLGEILTNQPDHAKAHILLASIFANRHALPEAQAHLDTALQLDPMLADAHYLRAMVYVEQSNTEEAKKSLNAALYCQRDHPLALFVLGNLLAQEGEIARANRTWQNAQRAIEQHTPDKLVSDMSDMTAGMLTMLIRSQLDGWEG